MSMLPGLLFRLLLPDPIELISATDVPLANGGWSGLQVLLWVSVCSDPHGVCARQQDSPLLFLLVRPHPILFGPATPGPYNCP